MRSPLDGVNATPLETNYFEWHGNFYFKEDHEHFPSMVVHFILELPSNYPNGIPSMHLLNPFTHSHVFNDTICFSLLKEWHWEFKGQTETSLWNPSRTIRSLLESVYIFLTVDEDKYIAVSKKSARADLQRARTVCCGTCGHNPRQGKVSPPEEAWMAALSASKLEDQVCALAMHEDLAVQERPAKKGTGKRQPTLQVKAVVVAINQHTRHGMGQHTVQDKFDARASALKAKAVVMVEAAPSASCTQSMDQDVFEDFRCCITGVAFDRSDNVVMGFGINVERRKADGTILSITTDLVPISMEVFYNGKIRTSALGAAITHFFPFAINEAHWTKAKRVLQGCVDAVLVGSQERSQDDSPNERLLFVVGELWKSMAVLMMKGESHTSEKVLKGFCALHHIMLLAADDQERIKGPFGLVDLVAGSPDDRKPCVGENLVNNKTHTDWIVVMPKKIPKQVRRPSTNSVLDIVERRVSSFVKHPSGRHKSNCPDFGRFLPLIMLSDLSWREIREPFVHELLARNSRWVVQTHRGLRRVHPSEAFRPSCRAVKSWGSSATGLKLTAFQIRFALNGMVWAQEALSKPVVAAYVKLGGQRLPVLAMYNKLGGRPTSKMLSTFQKEAKTIEAISCYDQFFRLVGMDLNEMQIQQLLCDAMLHSEKCHYNR